MKSWIELIYGHVINHKIINDPFKNGEFIQESFIIYVLGQAGDKITLVMGSKRNLYSWSSPDLWEIIQQ